MEALGSEQMVHFHIDAHRVRPGGATTADEDGLAGSGDRVARVEPYVSVEAGSRFRFAPNMLRMQFFDPDTELAIW